MAQPTILLLILSSPANYLLYNQDLRMAALTNITMKTHYSLLVTRYLLLMDPHRYDNCLSGHDITSYSLLKKKAGYLPTSKKRIIKLPINPKLSWQLLRHYQH